MPELPEVETVRRGLEPALRGARITKAEVRRPDLRFPLPPDLAERLEGNRVLRVGRRAKYLTIDLATDETLLVHLGMTGRFTVREVGAAAGPAAGAAVPGRFHREVDALGESHEHILLHAEGGAAGPVRVGFVDPRRFGYWDLVEAGQAEASRWLSGLGPEPLDQAWDGAALHAALAGRRSPIKAALLDQRVVAGLGNIYVCEALHRTGISPRREAAKLGAGRADRLAGAIKAVLEEAIDAGGSTLRDYADARGERGAFQHAFRAYGREGEPCGGCGQPIRRIVQSGRSTFDCGRWQR